jgi:hypothetical protein
LGRLTPQASCLDHNEDARIGGHACGGHVRTADADHRDAARELGQTLLQLLAVVVRGSLLDLRLDLADAALDVGFLAGTFGEGSASELQSPFVVRGISRQERCPQARSIHVRPAGDWLVWNRRLGKPLRSGKFSVSSLPFFAVISNDCSPL